MTKTTNYQQAVEYFNRLPNVTQTLANRAPARKFRKVLRLLGNPEKSLRFIHVTGTSGKGSVVAMLSNVLKAASYRTGSFYSPHLESPRERIQVNGRMIARRDFARLIAKLQPAIDCNGLTFFEAITVAAFCHFREQAVDMAVIEVSAGGRHDATNVITPVVSIIINVDYDHVRYLGGTLRDVATAKAGIIKHLRPVVTQETKPWALKIISQEAAAKRAPLALVNHHHLTFDLKLKGRHQQDNARVTVAAVEVLRKLGYQISPRALVNGLRSAWIPGRFEQLNDVILDGAHNPVKIRALVQALEDYFPAEKFVVVFAVRQTKRVKQMLGSLSEIARVIVRTEVPNDRNYIFVKAPIKDPAQAFARAAQIRHPGEKIVITGSLQLVGTLRPLVYGRPKIL